MTLHNRIFQKGYEYNAIQKSAHAFPFDVYLYLRTELKSLNFTCKKHLFENKLSNKNIVNIHEHLLMYHYKHQQK